MKKKKKTVKKNKIVKKLVIPMGSFGGYNYLVAYIDFVEVKL